MKMNKFKVFKILSVVFLLCGILSLFYPALNNLIFMSQQNKVIEDYNAQVQQLDQDNIDKIRAEAQAYNSNLSANILNSTSIEENNESDSEAVNGNMAYTELLSLNNEQMGYIVIPKIKLNQPIFHSTTDEILEIGIGHLEQSSLPIGGESTHSVLTGHSAIPGMMLFTDLEDMVIGDRFYIKILDEVLAYEVDQIEVVLPNDTSKLRIVEGKDYVTLLTCTPYSINTHRLLVRGIRTDYNGEIDEPDIENEKEESLTTSATAESSSNIDDSKLSFKFKLYYLVTPSIISVILIAIFIIIYKNRKRIKEKFLRKREKRNEA